TCAVSRLQRERFVHDVVDLAGLGDRPGSDRRRHRPTGRNPACRPAGGLDRESLRGHGARLNAPSLLDQLLDRARRLATERRAILGITGPPGSGKSTLAALLASRLDPNKLWVANVPMDGFHLADEALVRLGRRGRKGAIDTFDGDGYLALLRRIRAEL